MNIGAREGDEVVVFFPAPALPICGIVKHTPQDTGDSWVIVEGDGTIQNIQQFLRIEVNSRKFTEGK